MILARYYDSNNTIVFTLLRILIFLLLGLSLLAVRSARAFPAATPIIVNTTVDDFGGGIGCSLREAIQSANTGMNFGGCTGANAASNTITLPAGTYTLTGAANENSNENGDLDIKDNLTINGADAQTTIIQAGTNTINGVDRVLHIFNTYTVIINDVTIRFGKTPDGVDNASNYICSGGDGGGIYNFMGNLTLNNCVVMQNNTGNGGDGCTSDSIVDGFGGNGGGIYLEGGSVVLNNTSIRQNVTGIGGNGATGINARKGGYGGGIYIDDGVVTLTDSIIGDNLTGMGGSGNDVVSGTGGDGGNSGAGGGVYNFLGDLNMINSRVVGNATGVGGDGGDSAGGIGGEGGASGSGAGITNYYGTISVTSSVITENETGLAGSGGSGSSMTYGADGYRGSGGGLQTVGASAMTMLRDCTISDNDAQSGGGLTNESGATATGESCIFSGNVAADYAGGGIYNGSNATLTVVNSTISGNRAYINGGGIYSTGAMTLTFVTVAYNTADLDATTLPNGDGGGVYGLGSLSISNTIVASNYDKTGENPDCDGTILSGDYNLVGQVNPGCIFTAQSHDQVGTAGSPINPLLALILADNGGPTLTHAIKSTSPAADKIPAGINDCVAGIYDQRGIMRFPQCDIGAYEVDISRYVYVPMVAKD